MATNKTQATGGKPPKGLCRKKQTNKQQQTKTSACRNPLCFNFWIIWCKVSFLTQHIKWIIVCFDILRVQHLIHWLVYQFRHSVQSEEEKRILKQKKPSESMDNDITKTDYKQLTFRPTFPDKLSDKLDHCICPQTCHTLGGGTPLCKTCTVVCCPKGYGFYAFSCLTTGIDFAHLGLEWGIVSEGLSY